MYFQQALLDMGLNIPYGNPYLYTKLDVILEDDGSQTKVYS